VSELRFGNGWIVTRDEVLRGGLIARHGVVAEIGRGLAGGVDLEGDFLIPGLVELHTDVLEQHLYPRPGVRWPAAAAIVAYDAALVGAGITTVFDSLPVGYGDKLARREADPCPVPRRSARRERPGSFAPSISSTCGARCRARGRSSSSRPSSATRSSGSYR
jgi:alpha-D-ribose 1-methylphosphonate 5-triphosphate diphosphatase